MRRGSYLIYMQPLVRRTVPVTWPRTRRMRLKDISPLAALTFAGFAALAASLSPVSAHGGGLDDYGCHNDRKAGTYHCHRGACAGKTFSSQKEMLADACRKSPKPR